MIYFIYFLIGLSFIDMFSQLPIMSTYALDLGATTMFIGFIIGIYSFSNMISNVFSGDFVDRLGSRIILIIGLLATGLILFLYAFVTTPLQLFIVRLLHGISAGLLVPAAFTSLSLYKTNKSGKTMALSGAAVGFAAIFGPAFSGIVTKYYGIEWVFYIVGGLMIISGIISPFLIKNNSSNKSNKTNQFNWSSYFDLFKNLRLNFAYTGAFTLMFSQGILAYMLPLKVADLGLDSQISGMLMSVFGVVAILFFVLPTNKLYDAFRKEYIIVVGMLLIAVSLVFLSKVELLPILYLIMSTYGIGFALLFPSISSLISQNSQKHERGKAYGLFYGFFSLGVVAGSTVTGMFNMTSEEAFLTGSVFLTFVSIILLVSAKKLGKTVSLNNKM
ncbi:MFS transporter [Bacillus kwashiorkori]|uniref:MFS transporter n=1 Tax=Bacillus kwashiorkori TaxID=1522318 RepID=UPI0007835912|nr:MFS transporter [Bacillus kwashiorkori]